MKCPKCQVELRITRSRNVEEDGKLVIEQDLTCMNRVCPNYNTVVETVEIEEPVS